MRLEINSRGVRLGEAAREMIERRILFALGRFESRISHVDAMVEDVNGPRGGVDKRCKILVKLDRLGELAAESSHAELLGAVAIAADRIGRAVAKRLDRRLAVRRQSGPALEAE